MFLILKKSYVIRCSPSWSAAPPTKNKTKQRDFEKKVFEQAQYKIWVKMLKGDYYFSEGVINVNSA